MFKDTTVFVGLDLGDKQSELCFLDPDGQVIEESPVPATPSSLKPRLASLPPCRVAMEVGVHSRWVSALLTRLGHEVNVADARKLRLIYNNPRKHDQAEAEYRARLTRQLHPATALNSMGRRCRLEKKRRGGLLVVCVSPIRKTKGR